MQNSNETFFSCCFHYWQAASSGWDRLYGPSHSNYLQMCSFWVVVLLFIYFLKFGTLNNLKGWLIKWIEIMGENMFPKKKKKRKYWFFSGSPEPWTRPGQAWAPAPPAWTHPDSDSRWKPSPAPPAASRWNSSWFSSFCSRDCPYPGLQNLHTCACVHEKARAFVYK